MTKIADPRRVLLGWVIFLIAVVVVGALAWPYGLGRFVDQSRRQFVAYGYLQQAQREASAKPVQRAAALHALDRAVRLASDRPQITEQAAQLYIGLRAYNEALPWLRQLGNQSLLTRVSLGQALVMTGHRAEGEQVLQGVLDGAAKARQAGSMPATLYALLLNDIGYVNTLAGFDLSGSRNLVQLAVTLQPQQPAFIDSLGWAEYRLGDYADAAFYLERAIRLYLPEESAEMYYHLGAAYARLGRTREAKAALQRCLDLDRSMTEARHELEQLFQELPAPALACSPGRADGLGGPASAAKHG